MPVHKVALVGAGRMGCLHGGNAAASPRFELVAIADHNQAMAEDLARRSGSAVASYEAAIADPAIEAVLIASSTSSHLENAAAALAAGKAVFCEKPLSLDAGLLAERLPELDAAGPPIMVAFNRRFDPHFRDLKRRLDAGEAGDIETIHIINHDPAPPDPAFVPRSGGLFRDFTIHDFDTVSWLLEEDFAELFAAGAGLVDARIAELGDIDTAKLVLRSRSGRLCMISNSRRSGCGYDQRIEVFGSRGGLAVDNVHVTRLRHLDESGCASAPFPYSFAERYADAYRTELDHFADVLEGLATPATGPRESLKALRLADAAEQSLESGASVALSFVEQG
jgi:myo-inositol 2-dehydrogenase/D-chiro-inositol 1-dehydrogenase